MKNTSSQQVAQFDPLLLSVEELFCQLQRDKAMRQLAAVSPESFEPTSLAHGLYLALCCEAKLCESKYAEAIKAGESALKILAPSSLNRRVGRILWNLSRANSLSGNLTDAEMRARDSISAYRRSEYRSGVVDGLNELAKISFIKSQYARSIEFLQDALALLGDDPAKEQQIRSNLGRVKILAGQWGDAYYLLSAALEYDLKHSLGISAARNHLSLGYLRFRQRRFSEALKHYASAETLIEEHNIVRDRLILQEYRGELALAKGDYREARAILVPTLEQSKRLAPDSALVTQVGRILSEVFLELELIDEALQLSQQTLERSEKLGELVEVGLCHVLVGAIFARSVSVNSNQSEAIEYYEKGIDLLRKIGDPLEIGKALLRAPDVYGSEKPEKTLALLREARKTLADLDVDFYNATAALAFAKRSFESGHFSDGYQPLCEARELFDRMGDQAYVRQIETLTKKVASEAVASSLSQANSFNLFGGFAAEGENEGLQGADFEKSVETLRLKTGSERAVILSLEADTTNVITNTALNDAERRQFADTFMGLLGEEIAKETPTLLLDCSRDPYINKLLPSGGRAVVSSVIVTPLKISGDVAGYLYLDRLGAPDRKPQSWSPYSQDDLNFAVGYAGFVALEMAQAQKAKLVEDNNRLKEQIQQKVGFPNIITRNPEMLELLARVRQIVDADISINIYGETGSGKDLLAKAIHYNSFRRDKRFISVNCAALPETLLESELFGYKRGAFTGADRDKSGLFEEADGGTFFLDEIGDMPLSVQAKILRVLEEKEVVRLGDTEPRKVDVRIISATHKDLHILMDKGEFRQDLYFRLCALNFELPALRDRREDIPLLIDHLCPDPQFQFAAETMQGLVSYDWPGNIRELENEIKKLCLLCGENKVIEPDLLSQKIFGDRKKPGGDVNALSSNGSFSSGNFQPAEINANGDEQDFSLYDFIANHERNFITNALSKTHGVKKHAAALLNIPESTLRLKIKQYDIDLSASGLSA